MKRKSRADNSDKDDDEDFKVGCMTTRTRTCSILYQLFMLGHRHDFTYRIDTPIFITFAMLMMTFIQS